MQYADYCPVDFIRGISINTGIVLRRGWTRLSVHNFAKIPSGQSAYINILSSGIEGYDNPTGIGMKTGAIVSIRPYNPLFTSVYDYNLHAGKQTWMIHSFTPRTVWKKSYQLSHANLKDLEGTYSYLTYSRSGLYYPTPYRLGQLATRDAFVIFISKLCYRGKLLEAKARAANATVVLSGWRG